MDRLASPRLRILEVNKFYPPHIGGIERVVQDLTIEFGRRGHRVRVLACRSSYGPRMVERRDGAVVIYAASFGSLFSTPLSFDFFRLYFRLTRWADIVHWHEPCPPATVAALLTSDRMPRVVTWHADITRQRLLRPFFVRLQRAALARATRVVPTSRQLASHSAVVEADAVTTEPIPIGIALSDVARTDESQPQETVRDGPVLARYALFVGRLVYYKGLDVLLEAASLTNVTLVIIGSGPLLPKVRDDIERRRLGNRVRLIERRVDDAELKLFYRNCEYLVLPSTHSAEAFGMVQVEAMAWGKPVINTGLPTGVPSVSLNGITGITVQPGNARPLAEAMERLWRDDRLRARLGDAARTRAYGEFDRSTMAVRYLRLFSRCLEAGKAEALAWDGRNRQVLPLPQWPKPLAVVQLPSGGVPYPGREDDRHDGR